MKPTSPEPLAPPTGHVTTTRIVAVRGDALEFRADRVVGEEPLEIRAAGPGQDPVAIAVTMRTPGFEDELAIGFLRSEGLIEGPEVLRTTTGDPAALNQPDDQVTVHLARAFSHFLALANVAEQHHLERRRRAHKRHKRNERASLDGTLQKLIDSGVDKDVVYRAVVEQQVELVLTAHPTEINRRTLLQKHNDIAKGLNDLDRDDLDDDERKAVVDGLRRRVAEIWHTDEIRHKKPTPLEEAQGGLFVFEQTLWNALPAHLRAVDAALLKHTGKSLPLDKAPMRFGSWMGGDRDGNPFVTAEVTRRAVALGRWMAADLFHDEADTLRAELSLAVAGPSLRAALQLKGDEEVHEPYRLFLREVRDQLAALKAREKRIVDKDVVTGVAPIDVAGLEAALLVVWRSLHETGAAVVAQGRLLDLLRRVRAFGLTLVRLDIRQDASRHTATAAAITQALGLGDYAAWSEDERIAFLTRELAALGA